LKILHIHTLPIISGSGINTLLTMQGSVREGHEVTLACESEGRLTGAAETAGVQILLVPSLGREINPVRDLLAVKSLSKLIQKHRFDIVHTHNSKAGIVGRLAARMAKAPLIIHTVHGFAFHDAESLTRRILFRTLERTAAHWCDGMIFISKPLEDWAQREGIGRRIPHQVIYSGIDVTAFQIADMAKVRRELGISHDSLVVGIISKLWEGKGHRVLFHAWKKIQERWDKGSQPILLVVGEGPLAGSLRDLAVKLNIAATVVFTGFRADVPDVTAAVDIAVLPSAFEGMGRVLLEAMAAGKPVVASNVGGIPDLVEHGRTGLLVPPNKVPQLADALELLLVDEQQRQTMAKCAATSIMRKYSAEGMVEDIHLFYETVARNKKDVKQA